MNQIRFLFSGSGDGVSAGSIVDLFTCSAAAVTAYPPAPSLTCSYTDAKPTVDAFVGALARQFASAVQHRSTPILVDVADPVASQSETLRSSWVNSALNSARALRVAPSWNMPVSVLERQADGAAAALVSSRRARDH
ncbi:Uncharacterized protein PBTT_07365 [Plasmodiophora brassicae]|nr:hypothetical protein PBRA_009729 [Plasmodiophora brassicae]